MVSDTCIHLGPVRVTDVLMTLEPGTFRNHTSRVTATLTCLVDCTVKQNAITVCDKKH